MLDMRSNPTQTKQKVVFSATHFVTLELVLKKEKKKERLINKNHNSRVHVSLWHPFEF